MRIFRKQRFKLAAESRFAKYLRYAIGEIFLVVIGILIALQVNNWNENRKLNNKVIANLKAVQSELAVNIHNTDGAIDNFIARDSVKNQILKNKLTYSDYKKTINNRTLFFPFNYDNLYLNTVAFNNLTQNSEEIPQKYAPILDILNYLYIKMKTRIDVLNQRYQTTVYRNMDDLYRTKSWIYEDEFKGTLSDEAIRYFRTNSQYKARVFRTINDASNLSWAACNFRKNAIDAYLAIAHVLGNTNQTPDYISYTLKNPKVTDRYVGWYQQVYGPLLTEIGNRIEITKSGDQLFFATKTTHKTPIYYFRNSTFFFVNDGRLITFDKTGALTIINGNTDVLKFKKIIKIQ
ncbi:MAG: hypothetical protein JXR65_10955 [Bacteroidales bacterium]|nr:hypothetical protein [Bacteroidales bacterium]